MITRRSEIRSRSFHTSLVSHPQNHINVRNNSQNFHSNRNPRTNKSPALQSERSKFVDDLHQAKSLKIDDMTEYFMLLIC